MNRIALLLIALVLLAAVLGGQMLRRDAVSGVSGTSSTGAADAPTPRASAGGAGSYLPTPQSHPSDGPPARLIRIGDPMYGVRTQAEADWLNRNRFPVREPGLGLSPTAADLEGPLTAEAIGRAELAAMLRPELRDRALARLRQAAEDGSISALRALSQAYEFRRRDVVMADAYERAAEMRGDWNPRIATYDLDSLQAMASQVLAHRILHDIDQARRRRGLAPLVRDERPGLVETSDALLQAHRAGGLRLPAPPPR